MLQSYGMGYRGPLIRTYTYPAQEHIPTCIAIWSCTHARQTPKKGPGLLNTRSTREALIQSRIRINNQVPVGITLHHTTPVENPARPGMQARVLTPSTKHTQAASSQTQLPHGPSSSSTDLKGKGKEKDGSSHKDAVDEDAAKSKDSTWEPITRSKRGGCCAIRGLSVGLCGVRLGVASELCNLCYAIIMALDLLTTLDLLIIDLRS